MSATEDEYNLIFEGPMDDSPETMRRLKAALLVDMSFSIDQIQEALSKTPYTLISTNNEADLKQYASLLKAAGGKTCIVKASSEAIDSKLETDEEDHYDLSINFDENEDLASQPLESVPDDEEDDFNLLPVDTKEGTPVEITKETEADFDFGLSMDEEVAEEAPKPEPKPPVDLSPPKKEVPAVSLDLSFDEEATPAETSPPPPKQQTQIQNNETAETEETVEFSFTIGEEEAPKPKKAKTYKLSLDEQPESEIPEMLEKEPVGPIVSLLAKVKDRAEKGDDILSHDETPATSPDQGGDNLDLQPAPVENESHPLLKGKNFKEENPLASSLQSRAPSTLKKQETIDEPADEPADQPEPEEPVLRKPSKKFSLKEILLPLLFGLVLMGGGNWAYFEFSNNQEAFNFTEKLKGISKSLVASYVKEDANKEPEVVYHILTGSYEGVQNYQNRSVKANAHVSIEDKKIKVLAEFTTPEPPELSLEQVGRNEKKQIWIKSVDVDNGTYDITTKGTFEGQAPARIYLDDNGDGKRLIGTGKISGKIDAELKTVEISVSVVYGAPQAGGDLVFKQKSSSDFDLSINGKTVLKKAE